MFKAEKPIETLLKLEKNPEFRVYYAIILQAVLDASNLSFDNIRHEEILEAREWLFNKSSNFEHDCQIINLNPDYVRGLVKEILLYNLKNIYLLNTKNLHSL